ncbi:exocyst complex component 4-like isoform X3 [Asterias rubens]|uniref:exocyst complex component 4-like isoform X1 n=1 Tax=Asterias rubens TaxID=7604 RepID=UPI0014558845|nr:exocyst complex component 4-like isoform X1 [Asterias rubens]XP_033633234.1 exocyst complex component 4-like isoform X2 [Asterias rubens]XP_033633235.1 exocyst complex component 4-like isoform X3 [Asterias rubens]
MATVRKTSLKNRAAANTIVAATGNSSSKQPKESTGTGLLMSVIRTLSASEDLHQREVEKAKLEKAYRECDQKLDKLIAVNYDTLTKTIQAYSAISSRIKFARERVKSLKSDLLSCKDLLHCRRDELRKLWLDGMEQKHVLTLLDQIEEVKNVPQKLDGYLKSKHYLHATELITKTVAQLESDLSGVEALSELKMEMSSRKEQLHKVLIEELSQHLYEKSAVNFQVTFTRGGSFRSSGQDAAPTVNKKHTLLELAATAKARRSSRTHSLSLTVPDGTEEDIKPVVESLNDEPEDNPEHYMAILVESLSLLKRIPEAVEAIKRCVQVELSKIVQRTTTEVAENAKQRGENITQHNQPKLLVELLDLLFERFQCVAMAHMCVLGSLQRTSGSSDVQLYTMDDIWSNVQTVLQVLLGNYLDVRNVTASVQQTSSAFTDAPTDIGLYFSRRKSTRNRKVPLFRFEMSSHAISMTNYMREQKQEYYGFAGKTKIKETAKDGTFQTEDEKEGEEAPMVCKPSVKNITLIFKPLNSFIKDIEIAMSLPDGRHCTLHEFISDYVKDIFLGHLLSEIETNLHTATKGNDALKSLVDSVVQKSVSAPRPLLNSTVIIDRAISDLRQLMMDLPTYADQFLNMICNILQEYKDTCYAIYRGLVQPESEDKRIVSASWVKDEDINQCLRLLPNWANLQALSKQGKDGKDSTVLETIEDIRERNAKESELLVTNLGDKLLQGHEVLCDIPSLKLLANLHESLEWFSSGIRMFAGSLPSSGINMLMTPGGQTIEIPAVEDSLLHTLISQAKEFKELADICLLVLHLELRLHCFYYLLPVAKQSSFFISADNVDPDPNVLKLNKDLTTLEEALNPSLMPHKFKYVFEGLGHLISFILINSAQYVKRINENGIKKMCRNIFILQQNLTNITMSRETDLDHARNYYELMYKNTDEILNGIVEQGAFCKELEYRNLVHLQQRSSPAFDQKQLTKMLKKLEEIMMEAV